MNAYAIPENFGKQDSEWCHLVAFKVNVKRNLRDDLPEKLVKPD